MLNAYQVVIITILSMTLLAACGQTDLADIPPRELVQSGCSDNADCAGDRCIVGVGEGLCSANCTTQDDCPTGTICADTEAVRGVCLLSCTNSSECTEHLGSAFDCDTESDLTTGQDVHVCIDGR